MKFHYSVFIYLALFITTHTCYALNATQQKSWLEDINFYVEQVKTKHINAFHTLSESQFDNKIANLKANLSLLNETQIELALMKITHAIGDGHSNYYLMSGPHKHYPLRFKKFNEDIRIVAASQNYQHLVGSKLIALNDKPITQVYALIKDYLPGVDNQFSEVRRFEFYLTLAKLLYGTGLVEKDLQVRFTIEKDNKKSSHIVHAVSMREFMSVKNEFTVKSPEFNLQEIAMPGIKVAFINDAAYFAFKRYPQISDIQDNCEALQNLLSKKKSKRLIIDLRDNDGGNFYSGLAFSACLLPQQHFDWQKGALILINNGTFSAAMSNAVQFQQILNGTLIGEPTGGDPNGYAESYRFELPYSKRKLSLSIRYYPFLNKQTDAVYPDIMLTNSWPDYFNGIDSVLLKALTH